MKRRRRWWLLLVLCVLLGCNSGNLSSGDRVLVAKFLYDTDLKAPEVFDVVVFRYPKEPVEKGSPKNYIKRLLGLPGQILALFFGQVFFWDPKPGDPPLFDDRKDPTLDPNDLWKEEHLRVNDEKARALFEAGKFKILRKPPAVMMELRRIVYDNEHQARNLGAEFRRWPAINGWSTSDQKTFAADAASQDVSWLRYRNLIPPSDRLAPGKIEPELITDFLGYNSTVYDRRAEGPFQPNWVGDLMLECDVEVKASQGEFWMELSKGVDRFRARWDLASGECTLFRVGQDKKPQEMVRKPSEIKAPGTYQVRFANFDARLTVWINGALLFGDGVKYDPPEVLNPEKDKGLEFAALEARRGPTANDLEPASVGAKAAQVQVGKLRLWRDTYYTMSHAGPDIHLGGEALADPSAWDAFKKMSFKTMYVQPGHYLCLGDNSTSSSDSRHWGLVPERLLLGRALLVYYPLNRAGPIR